jgi:hypothetical protein
LEAHQRHQGSIKEEGLTQRLRTIYRKFTINGKGYKLPQLQRYLAQQYQQSRTGLSRFGLSRIHATFPTDTLPSLSLYSAGPTLLAAPFLHGALAIHTFQLELDLRASDALLNGPLLNDFERMRIVSRPFLPAPDRNWRNALKILFTDRSPCWLRSTIRNGHASPASGPTPLLANVAVLSWDDLLSLLLQRRLLSLPIVNV